MSELSRDNVRAALDREGPCDCPDCRSVRDAAHAWVNQQPARDEEIGRAFHDAGIPLPPDSRIWRACERFHGISPPQASERKDGS